MYCRFCLVSEAADPVLCLSVSEVYRLLWLYQQIESICNGFLMLSNTQSLAVMLWDKIQLHRGSQCQVESLAGKIHNECALQTVQKLNPISIKACHSVHQSLYVFLTDSWLVSWFGYDLKREINIVLKMDMHQPEVCNYYYCVLYCLIPHSCYTAQRISEHLQT